MLDATVTRRCLGANVALAGFVLIAHGSGLIAALAGAVALAEVPGMVWATVPTAVAVMVSAVAAWRAPARAPRILQAHAAAFTLGTAALIAWELTLLVGTIPAQLRYSPGLAAAITSYTTYLTLRAWAPNALRASPRLLRVHWITGAAVLCLELAVFARVASALQP